MPDDMEGLKDVLKELKEAGGDIVKGVAGGMQMAVIATSSHIKRGYNRPNTGKGFANQTGRLRASIGQAVIITRRGVIGVVYAGTSYAIYVEFRWSGKYAYLWPGVIDMRKTIIELLEKGAKKGLKG